MDQFGQRRGLRTLAVSAAIGGTSLMATPVIAAAQRPAPAATVSATVYVDKVCSARVAFDKKTVVDVDHQPKPSSSAVVNKRNAVHTAALILSQVTTESDAIANAGVPAVPNGTQLAGAIKHIYDLQITQIQSAVEALQAAPTSSSAAFNRVDHTQVNRLNRATLGAFRAGAAKLKSPALVSAYDAYKDC